MSEPGSPTPPDAAMLDLLIKQLTEDLSPEEQRTLDGMDRAVMSACALDVERAAAAISLAATAGLREFPSQTLRSRIEQDASTLFAESQITALKSFELTPVRPRPQSRASAAGWYAAAACLLLAAFGWLRSSQLSAPPTANMPSTVPSIAPPPSPTPVPPKLAEERAALLALPQAVRLNLNATKDPAAAGVSADAVWDPVTQRGFLRIVGLKPNDPRMEQYQAWIFDASRDQRYPLSAGVFDVGGNSAEVIVPLHADLPVRVAKAFAVTVEAPGGVVVPALHHVVALGAVTTG